MKTISLRYYRAIQNCFAGGKKDRKTRKLKKLNKINLENLSKETIMSLGTFFKVLDSIKISDLLINKLDTTSVKADILRFKEHIMSLLCVLQENVKQLEREIVGFPLLLQDMSRVIYFIKEHQRKLKFKACKEKNKKEEKYDS